MKSAKQKYEELAQKYFDTNDPQYLLKGWGLATAVWWSYGKGAKHDGISETVKNYLEVCQRGLYERWIDAYIDERDNCSLCGESYRVDNMSVCTHCFSFYCWRCVGRRETHPNGNYACGCGGELVG
jgi:hypothetical protein